MLFRSVGDHFVGVRIGRGLGCHKQRLALAVRGRLEVLLMIVIHWGAAGAALATVIAKAVPAMISLVILKRDTTGVRIRFQHY